jgi:hypothetical protein
MLPHLIAILIVIRSTANNQQAKPTIQRNSCRNRDLPHAKYR